MIELSGLEILVNRSSKIRLRCIGKWLTFLSGILSCDTVPTQAVGRPASVLRDYGGTLSTWWFCRVSALRPPFRSCEPERMIWYCVFTGVIVIAALWFSGCERNKLKRDIAQICAHASCYIFNKKCQSLSSLRSCIFGVY